MRTIFCVCLIVLTGLVGCGGGVKEETVAVPTHDPLKNAKSTLDNYVNGQPVTSEVTTYDDLVADVQKVDPAKAEILKAGLDAIKKNPNQARAKAKELLKKLDLDDKK